MRQRVKTVYPKEKRRVMAHGDGNQARYAKEKCYVMLGFPVNVLFGRDLGGP